MTFSLSERAAFDDAWQQSEERRAFWDAHRSEFVAAYPDQFVAVAKGSVIGSDPDLL